MRILCTADCGFHDSSGCCDIIMIGEGLGGVNIWTVMYRLFYDGSKPKLM